MLRAKKLDSKATMESFSIKLSKEIKFSKKKIFLNKWRWQKSKHHLIGICAIILIVVYLL
jgi:hypothetical protein